MADPQYDDQFAILALPNLAHVEMPDGPSVVIDAGAVEHFEAMGYEVVVAQVTPPLPHPIESISKKDKAVEATLPDLTEA